MHFTSACKAILLYMEEKMSINKIPKDPNILLSYINTELRDNYDDLVDFCVAHSVDINDIVGRLRSIDYTYDAHINQFV